MDITSVVSLIVSSIALLISILGILYSRRRTKLMEKQLEQQRQQLGKKKRFEEVSKTILQAVRMLKKTRLEDFYAFPMAEISSEVLGHIHDNQLEMLDLMVKPQKLEVSYNSFLKEYVAKDFKNVKKIIYDTYSILIGEHNDVTSSIFYFDCNPKVLSASWIDVGDALSSIKQMFLAYGLLEKFADDIAFFDNTILDNLKQNIHSILEMFLESLVSEHKITFSKADKSKQIFQKLNNEIMGLESISVLLKELSVEMCDKRLIAVQKEIFSKS